MIALFTIKMTDIVLKENFSPVGSITPYSTGFCPKASYLIWDGDDDDDGDDDGDDDDDGHIIIDMRMLVFILYLHLHIILWVPWRLHNIRIGFAKISISYCHHNVGIPDDNFKKYSLDHDQ